MDRTDRPYDWINIGFVGGLHVVALSLLAWYLATGHQILLVDVLGAAALWVLTGLGITAGYHRLLAHRGFKANRWIARGLTLLGGAAAQNSALAWVADHRRHHQAVDTEVDPYNAKWGFVWSHIEWILRQDPHGDPEFERARDLRSDPFFVWQDRYYLLSATLVNFALVCLVGAATGRWLAAFVIGGFVRVVVVQHFTFCINSLAHIWGSQPFSTANTARDNWLLGVITLGEGYHNYHHAFDSDYRNGLAWYSFDPTKWLIYGLSKVGLASDLRRTPEHVVLRRRFEEGRRTASERVEEWMDGHVESMRARAEESRTDLLARFDRLTEQMEASQLAVGSLTETYKEQLRAKAEELRRDWEARSEELQAALRTQLADAEARLEAALAELKQRRAELVRALKARAEATADVRRAMSDDLRALRRQVKEARRSAREALAAWERTVSELQAPAAA